MQNRDLEYRTSLVVGRRRQRVLIRIVKHEAPPFFPRDGGVGHKDLDMARISNPAMHLEALVGESGVAEYHSIGMQRRKTGLFEGFNLLVVACRERQKRVLEPMLHLTRLSNYLTLEAPFSSVQATARVPKRVVILSSTDFIEIQKFAQ